MSPKMAIWSFLGYLGDIESHSQAGPVYALLCHGKCFQFSSPNLQCFTSFDFRKLHPLFGWPSSYPRAVVPLVGFYRAKCCLLRQLSLLNVGV